MNERIERKAILTISQYEGYTLAIPSGSGPAPTGQAAVGGPAPPVADDPQKEVVVTPGVAGDSYTEEKVEYRDEDGNLLDEEQVAALEGKVSFSTRYETRTRMIDQYGNEIDENGMFVEQGEDVEAGTRADGIDPETIGRLDIGDEKTVPASNVAVDGDLAKESSVLEVQATAEAEAEAAKATKDEL